MRAQRQRGRRWREVLALLAGAMLVLGVSAAQVPGPWHRDDVPHACPICTLGCQPAPVVPTSLLVEPPAPPRFLASPRERPARLLSAGDHSPSRGPPA